MQQQETTRTCSACGHELPTPLVVEIQRTATVEFIDAGEEPEVGVAGVCLMSSGDDVSLVVEVGNRWLRIFGVKERRLNPHLIT